VRQKETVAQQKDRKKHVISLEGYLGAKSELRQRALAAPAFSEQKN
jgi:hypothetical protein